MCAVSVISGHYQGQYPDARSMPSAEYPNFKELVRKAQAYDDLTRQRDCQDAEKARWMKELEDHMELKYGLLPIR